MLHALESSPSMSFVESVKNWSKYRTFSSVYHVSDQAEQDNEAAVAH